MSTEGTLSEFPDFFLQPIIKDRPNIVNIYENYKIHYQKGRNNQELKPSGCILNCAIASSYISRILWKLLKNNVVPVTTVKVDEIRSANLAVAQGQDVWITTFCPSVFVVNDFPIYQRSFLLKNNKL